MSNLVYKKWATVQQAMHKAAYLLHRPEKARFKIDQTQDDILCSGYGDDDVSTTSGPSCHID